MVSYGEDKEKILLRLKRIEGQLRGIQRMVDEDKYCVDVLVQISSVIAGAKKVGLLLLDDHIKGCVGKAIAAGDESALEELTGVVQRFARA
ncbi:MAG: metal-sensitive transcriptional regulator [Candidatus Aquicultorales bacterium]